MTQVGAYNAQDVEDKWYQYWMEHNYFHSEVDDREPYTIVIPPPNVTGILHMGHMLNNTIQDVLIRRARLKGFNACWVPGTDHASIATEAKVVARLKEQGIEKADLTREEFLKHAWDWTDEYGGVILDQLKKLGASCDWERTKFTLDPAMSSQVIKSFVDLYNKGLIYRGYRMVNWDPQAKTTLSDEEVNYVEQQGDLFYISYKIQDSDQTLTIATTRPETIFGDTAICINPDDERFAHLKGKKAIVPICNRVIPIIEDTYVDVEFGTGCLKVTPAHDQNDKMLGDKHKLEVIDIFNEDATLNSFGLHYQGKDRFVVRTEIKAELEQLGALVKTEQHLNKVGTSERTKAVIEPRLSDQWFLKMEDLVKPAIKAVLEQDDVVLHPKKFENTYRHWMTNIRDWNISRQLWWGQQIPAYFYGDGKEDFVVAESIEDALKLAKEKTSNASLKATDLRQDPDALDTWFSSWLWPMSVFDGLNNPDNKEFSYYYPTNDLVTGPDILFFWVARMIISGYEFRKEKPFSKVYLTGLVRDEKGRKMSKQLGNSPDALKLIESYGADAVRVGLMLSSAAGNDLLFDENLCQQGKNFANKIWNAYRLIDGWEIEKTIKPSVAAVEALDWYENHFNKTIQWVDENFEKYRISDALMTTYKLIWDDFCSWLLELAKPAYGKPIDAETHARIIRLFENNLRLLHPFMPFLTEELWHYISEREVNHALTVSSWPEALSFDNGLITDFEITKEIVAGIRNFRKDKNISFKEKITVYVTNSEKELPYQASIVKLGMLDEIIYSQAPEKINGGSFRVSKIEFFIPTLAPEDPEAEKEKLQAELKYTQGFLASVEKKLANERFVANAPEQVIAIERKKASDAEEKITMLQKSLSLL